MLDSCCVPVNFKELNIYRLYLSKMICYSIIADLFFKLCCKFYKTVIQHAYIAELWLLVN